MAIATLKPATVGASQNPTAASKIGSDANDDFIINMWSFDVDGFSPLEDVQGDTDPYPRYENNGLLYGNVVISGVAVAEQAIGFKNIVDSTKNPTTSVTILISNNRKLVFNMAIERVRVRWNKSAVNVPVVIVGRISNTNPANIEAAV